MENEILSLVTIANLYKYVHVLQVFSLIDKYIARDHQPNFGFQTICFIWILIKYLPAYSFISYICPSLFLLLVLWLKISWNLLTSFSALYRLLESYCVQKLVYLFSQIIFIPFPQAVLCIPLHIKFLLLFSHSVMSDSCDPMDYSPPGSSLHRIFQARILE